VISLSLNGGETERIEATVEIRRDITGGQKVGDCEKTERCTQIHRGFEWAQFCGVIDKFYICQVSEIVVSVRDI
jgi:hypothetical protein